MGKNYDAYAIAARAEADLKAQYQADPTPDNQAAAALAEAAANDQFQEVLKDPQG